MVVILGAMGIKETRRDCGLEGRQRPPGRGTGSPGGDGGGGCRRGAGRNSEPTLTKAQGSRPHSRHREDARLQLVA